MFAHPRLTPRLREKTEDSLPTADENAAAIDACIKGLAVLLGRLAAQDFSSESQKDAAGDGR